MCQTKAAPIEDWVKLAVGNNNTFITFSTDSPDFTWEWVVGT